VLVVFFGLLFFSNVIAGLSRLYLSGDLDLCHAAPVPLEGLFLSRFVLTLVDSSWMLLIFGVPILAAYGLVFDASLGAIYPNFKQQSGAQVSTGFGGVLYMMVSLVYIGSVVVLELWSGHILFVAASSSEAIDWMRWLLVAGIWGLIAAITALAVWQPLKRGISVLKAYE
jgi:ABC-2 type transport system permease protein